MPQLQSGRWTIPRQNRNRGNTQEYKLVYVLLKKRFAGLEYIIPMYLFTKLQTKLTIKPVCARVNWRKMSSNNWNVHGIWDEVISVNNAYDHHGRQNCLTPFLIEVMSVRMTLLWSVCISWFSVCGRGWHCLKHISSSSNKCSIWFKSGRQLLTFQYGVWRYYAGR